MSQFLPDADGGILLHLDKREPIDEQKYEKQKPLLTAYAQRQTLGLVFADWLRKQRQDAAIETAQAQRPPQQRPPAGS